MPSTRSLAKASLLRMYLTLNLFSLGCAYSVSRLSQLRFGSWSFVRAVHGFGKRCRDVSFLNSNLLLVHPIQQHLHNVLHRRWNVADYWLCLVIISQFQFFSQQKLCTCPLPTIFWHLRWVWIRTQKRILLVQKLQIVISVGFNT